MIEAVEAVKLFDVEAPKRIAAGRGRRLCGERAEGLRDIRALCAPSQSVPEVSACTDYSASASAVPRVKVHTHPLARGDGTRAGSTYYNAESQSTL